MKHEGSRPDRKADKKGAKRHGMTMKEWERSPMDKKADANAKKKIEIGHKGKK